MTLPNPHDTPTLSVPAAGALLGLGRAASYAAVQRGDIPSIHFGRKVVVPTAAVLRMLALDVTQ
jgi:hypothetical protein